MTCLRLTLSKLAVVEKGSPASTASTDSITGRLQRLVGEQPHQTLIIAPETGNTLDYAGLGRLTTQLAAWFDANDIAPGDHVAMVLPNGLTASALFLATMAAGRTIAPLSLIAQPEQLRYVLAHCEAKCIFTCEEHSERIHSHLASHDQRVVVVDPNRLLSGPWISNDPMAAAAIPTLGSIETTGESGALLMYTSGTTGVPKGVPLTHGALLHSASAVAAWHELTPQDRVLSALPLYHINGQVIATLTPFVSGGSFVAPEKFSVSQWWQAAMTHECTWINLVPTIIAYLLNSADDAPPALPSIRFGRSASAPLPPEQQRAFEARFGFPIIEAMGMTESASVVFCNPMPPAERKIGSPGKPIGVEVKIVDESGEPQVDGTSGEIYLRGPSVMKGYFKSPEQTSGAISDDGWLRSGDLAYRDADGFFFITGRLKELIIKGGENIAPREIDEALLQHPDILEAAAVGMPDDAYGQEILAAIVLKPDCQLEEPELRKFCEGKLGRYKTPREFRFLKALPKGASGKVQRLRLLD